MWKILESHEIIRTSFFRLRQDKCEMSDGRVMPRYFTFDFPDWAMIIPITKDKKVVMVRQYRHSREDWFLEFPGGSTEPAKDLGPKGFPLNENPQLGAERELLEETGYKANRVIPLGGHCPNPALQSNKVHAFLGIDCTKVAEPSLDPYEEITVELITVDDLIKLAQSGKIKHSLMLATLLLALPHIK